MGKAQLRNEQLAVTLGPSRRVSYPEGRGSIATRLARTARYVSGDRFPARKGEAQLRLSDPDPGRLVNVERLPAGKGWAQLRLHPNVPVDRADRVSPCQKGRGSITTCGLRCCCPRRTSSVSLPGRAGLNYDLRFEFGTGGTLFCLPGRKGGAQLRPQDAILIGAGCWESPSPEGRGSITTRRPATCRRR